MKSVMSVYLDSKLAESIENASNNPPYKTKNSILRELVQEGIEYRNKRDSFSYFEIVDLAAASDEQIASGIRQLSSVLRGRKQQVPPSSEKLAIASSL